jgi:hypothetical protein
VDSVNNSANDEGKDGNDEEVTEIPGWKAATKLEIDPRFAQGGNDGNNGNNPESEAEIEVYSHRAKLFRYHKLHAGESGAETVVSSGDSSSWKERALGNAKIFRIVVGEGKVRKERANHFIFPIISFSQSFSQFYNHLQSYNHMQSFSILQSSAIICNQRPSVGNFHQFQSPSPASGSECARRRLVAWVPII